MSVSSVSLNSDVNSRYQRLATDYAKLRAQAKVLREGVLSERSKAEGLAEQLHAAETSNRKLEAENESLSFRNNQLVKRVENLQQEVDDNNRLTKKEKGQSKKTQPKENSKEVAELKRRIELLESELQRSMRTNEQLVTTIAENERIHDESIAEMSAKLATEVRKLEAEIEELRKSAAVSTPLIPHWVSGVVNRVEPQRIEDETADKAESEIDSIIDGMESPAPPTTIQEAAEKVVETVLSSLNGFQSFLSLLQQRTEIYPYDVTMETLPAHVQKLSAEFGQCVNLLNDPISKMTSFLENTEITFDDESTGLLEKLILHSKTMLPELLTKMANEENKNTWSSKQLEGLNDNWRDGFIKLIDSLEQLQEATQMKNLDQISERLRILADRTSELESTFDARWKIEGRMPTTTRRMKCVNGALHSSLKLLNTELAKLNGRVERIVVLKSETEVVKNPNPFDSDIEPPTPTRERTFEIPQVVPIPCEQCEKRKLSEKSEQVPQSKELKVINVELDYLRERNSQLESEKDRTIVDISLLRKKLEMVTSKSTDLSDIDHLREIGREQMKMVMKRLTKAECGMRFYRQECDVIVKTNLTIESEKDECKKRIEQLERQKQTIEDELASVRRSYEEQLHQLTEHIAELSQGSSDRNQNWPEDEPSKKQSSRSLKSFFKN